MTRVRAPAGAAARPATRTRRATPRAVVRWRFIKLRFALEGPHPTRVAGRTPAPERVSGGMRYRIPAVAAASLLLALPAHAANPQAAGLQVALRAQGLYTGRIDALVGPRTVRAVRAFQRQQGIPVTGRADLRTRVALGPFGRPLYGTRMLRRGMFGWDVSVLQFLLIRQGLTSPVNGYFDAPTARALRNYQRKLRLPADAIAGPATFAALGLQTRVPTAPARQPRRFRIYVVRPGDTLTKIAHAHGTSLRVLARANKLDPSRYLLIGAKLRVPVAVASPAPVATAAADTLAVRAALDRWSASYGVDAHLVRAVAWMESGYQQRVVSSVGAEGVMQLLPTTWQYVEDVLIGHPVEHSADGNVRVGVAYLHHLLQTFGGNERLALAAWYQGEAAVRSNGIYAVTKPFVDDVLALRLRM
ncbi:MAG: LysM peptidoglycan-binding domain-containing protein [Actinobacteria bacterium]|nr:MAG: LysM peptidoglycan-binding domain-containing protein [Actinomycetota bacterium]